MIPLKLTRCTSIPSCRVVSVRVRMGDSDQTSGGARSIGPESTLR